MVCCNSLLVSLVAISGSARNWGRKGDAMKQLRRELLQMEEEVRGGARLEFVGLFKAW